MVYDDIERLISYGESKSKIEKTLIDLNFNIKEIKQAKKWQNILSYSKNEVAIQIYKNAVSSEEGSNEYIDFAKKILDYYMTNFMKINSYLLNHAFMIEINMLYWENF